MTESDIAEILQKVGPRVEPPADLMAEVKANVKQAWRQEVEEHQQREQQRKGYKQWMGIAAGLVMLVGVATFFSTPAEVAAIGEVTQRVANIEFRTEETEWRQLTDTAIVPGMEIRSKAASYVAITLNSGMQLRLDQNSQVALKDIDNLFLETGGVYAASDGHANIEITTAFGSAKDIGTRFEVRKNPDAWRVQVREGKVKVQDTSNDILAVAGERVIIAQNQQVKTETVRADDSSWHWTQKVVTPFKIEGASLSEYLAWWSSETGQSFGFKNQASALAAEETILHGSIEGLSPDDSLEALLPSTHFVVVDRIEDQVIFDQAP